MATAVRGAENLFAPVRTVKSLRTSRFLTANKSPRCPVMSDARPRILMCPPDHYGIEYEINPWMSRERQADHALAVKQWQSLNQILQGLGAETPLLNPV